MNRFAKPLLVIGVAVFVLLGARAVIAKYATMATVAIALWNDPQVKKLRRRAAKELRKATKSAEKAARKAAKS